jgi:4-carboxymuconolactone decarboxylase
MNKAPRLSPVSPDDTDAQTKSTLERLAQPSAPGNPVLGTLMLHPDLAEIYMPFSDYLKNRGLLQSRDRELAILRIAWKCGADYQWVAHARYARDAGISDQEIERVAQGPDAPGWDPDDSALLCAVDELHRDQRIHDETWNRLRTRLDPGGLIELLMLVGNYQMIALVMNSVGIAPQEPPPDLPGNVFSFVARCEEPPKEDES